MKNKHVFNVSGVFLFISMLFLSCAGLCADEDNFLENLYIPQSFGKIEKQDLSASLRGSLKSPTVILVKDAHCHYEVQKNIIKIIDMLTKDYGIDMVYMEGAGSHVDTSILAEYPNKKKRMEVSNRYLKEGIFTGVESLSINNGINPLFNIYGVEDMRLYLYDLKAFRDTVSMDKEKIASEIKLLQKAVVKLKHELYPPQLIEFDKNTVKYKNGTEPLYKYLEFLENSEKVDAMKYPNINLITKIINREKEIDFRVLETERNDLLNNINNSSAKEGLKDIVKQSLLFKIGKMSPLSYYTFLEKYTSFDKLPNLQKYMNLLKLDQQMDYEKLMMELDLLQEDIYQNLLHGENDSELRQLDDYLHTLFKLIHLKATNKEVIYYFNHKAEFELNNAISFINSKTLIPYLNPQPIKHALSKAVKFYKLALKRDTAIVDNLLKRMTEQKRDKVILVCGGFHGDGIINLLKRKGLNVISIVPKISNTNVNEYQALYLKRMMDNSLNPENMLLKINSQYLTNNTAYIPPPVICDTALGTPDERLKRLPEVKALVTAKLRERMITYQDIQPSIDPAYTLRLTYDQKAKTFSANGIKTGWKDMVNGAFSLLLVEIGKVNGLTELWNTITAGFSADTNFAIEVADNLPTNSLRYYDKKNDANIIVFNKVFINGLLYAVHEKQYDRNTALWVLAQRLFHELGHRKDRYPKEEEIREEKRQMARDFILYWHTVFNKPLSKSIMGLFDLLNPNNNPDLYKHCFNDRDKIYETQFYYANLYFKELQKISKGIGALPTDEKTSLITRLRGLDIASYTKAAPIGTSNDILHRDVLRPISLYIEANHPLNNRISEEHVLSIFRQGHHLSVYGGSDLNFECHAPFEKLSLGSIWDKIQSLLGNLAVKSALIENTGIIVESEGIIEYKNISSVIIQEKIPENKRLDVFYSASLDRHDSNTAKKCLDDYINLQKELHKLGFYHISPTFDKYAYDSDGKLKLIDFEGLTTTINEEVVGQSVTSIQDITPDGSERTRIEDTLTGQYTGTAFGVGPILTARRLTVVGSPNTPNQGAPMFDTSENKQAFLNRVGFSNYQETIKGFALSGLKMFPIPVDDPNRSLDQAV